MSTTLAFRFVHVLLWAFAALGLVTVVLIAMIARPLTPPPPLSSISDTARAVDRSTLPGPQRFSAKDGTELTYRHYPSRSAAVKRIAVLVHGSSGSGMSVHALADALAARGVETYMPDMRGHGGSGTRGDIAYLGQLDDDLADLVGEIRKADATAPLTLIGHSAGGGFALRVAGSPIQTLFARTILLAPYLGYFAPTNRPNSGGWANANIPRIVALMNLQRFGITCCESLPVLAFAVPDKSEKILVSRYSERLRSNFGTSRDFRTDLAAASRPVAIYAGADDELMLSDHYAGAVRNVSAAVPVTLIDGVNHMGIVSDPRAISVIADDVATTGSNS